MPRDWFSLIPPYEVGATGSLSAILEDCQRESLTGLLRLQDASGDLFVWTFLKGKGQSLYKSDHQSWLPVLQSQWVKELDGLQSEVRKAQVPVSGLRACEVALRTGVQPQSALELSGRELLQQVQLWFEGQEAGFVRLQADNQELFGLMLGDGVPNMEVLLFDDGQTRFSLEDPGGLPVKADSPYRVELYVGDAQQGIWLENRLRLAFAVLVRMMIQRFGYMVGFALADRLCARLSEANQARGLEIKITSNGLENNQLFYSLQGASEAYSFILDNFYREASNLIGPRIAKEIAMKLLENLSPAQHGLLVTNLRGFEGPQFDLTRPLGK